MNRTESCYNSEFRKRKVLLTTPKEPGIPIRRPVTLVVGDKEIKLTRREFKEQRKKNRSLRRPVTLVVGDKEIKLTRREFKEQRKKNRSLRRAKAEENGSL